ncbi:IS4 family transposase [Paenibacillus sp. PAMC21692]|uniref:IS4 family transposase n=1 Tax=Paenibacillus sp. PAMC21692 TaxID=2762320 RepID=UPI00164DC475|nr:IS4 family transposase [Paenibacillus sp. PAMC21692]QNK55620.1 IS4 family transposase [Paenibacillus sp. PAMC21692]QNK56363.1 IS4 family transposase [Paenibacillus sp. PAMC21692]QNK57670.1 IS4 family transposase [Paenibacillus sp. PAMC21692]QNK57727.1 IS4 family transposase [Paenibacillus sp. PAMC21692]QNK59056.1 IS4 family transposase [Paenibacillus sp. PAMC21692]
MDNVTQNTVVRQLLSLLPLDVQDRLLYADRYAKKLTISKSILVFVLAQFNNWQSYVEMEEQIYAHSELRSVLDLPCISAAQLSRKLAQIPTEMLHELFLHGLVHIQKLTANLKGISPSIGRLALIDSSKVKLPLVLGDWARVSSTSSGVKLHVRLLTASPDVVYPDAVIPSTLNVGDRAATVELVTESTVTYVMDRGYDNYKNMDNWIRRGIRFVMRMRDRALTTVVEERQVTPDGSITRDAIVSVGGDFRSMKERIRLVEFYDEQGRFYRLLTSRLDITAEEVAHIYKCRWLIELFFKWIKQHLRLKKLHSYKPQAIWNQIYLTLITFMLAQYMQLHLETKKSVWRVLELFRIHMFHPWIQFLNALFRAPTRTSTGKKRGSSREVPPLRTELGMFKKSKVT